MTETILIIVTLFTIVSLGGLALLYLQQRRDDRELKEHLRSRYADRS